MTYASDRTAEPLELNVQTLIPHCMERIWKTSPIVRFGSHREAAFYELYGSINILVTTGPASREKAKNKYPHSSLLGEIAEAKIVTLADTHMWCF